MGNSALVKAAIGGLGFGKKLPEDFYFHLSQEPLLAALLRLIVFAARQIVGDVECDLIKISTDGRSVSRPPSWLSDELAALGLDGTPRA